jgi:cytochrome P450/ferredoxin
MTGTSGTHASHLPLHMRRNAFDPTPELREIRETAGVRTATNSFGTTVYLITRYEDVKAVLSDHERFSNTRPPGFFMPGAPQLSDEELAASRAGNLLALDPPEHQRLRRLLTPEFTIRRMKRLEPRIIEIVDQHLDAMESAGPPIDLVESFALPIPSLVICELLGVPYDDRDDFQRRSARQLDLSTPIAERVELQRQGRDYMQSLVDRARRHPGDDILGMLVREHGDECTDAELIGIASLLLLAGHETTSNMLGLGTLALLRHPEQLAAVRDDPDAVAPAVEELLRWLSIVHSAIPRLTTTDVEVAGVRIPEGRTRFRVDAVRQSGPRLHRRPRDVRHRARCDRTLGIRTRSAPLPRRSARADGDADRIPGVVAPVSHPGAGRGLRRRAVQVVPFHLRPEVVGGDLDVMGDDTVRVEADRDLCISAGNCVMSAPAVFDQDDDGIVVVLADEVPEGAETHVRDAVKLCPAEALRIVD